VPTFQPSDARKGSSHVLRWQYLYRSSGHPVVEGDDPAATLALALRLLGRGFDFSNDAPMRLLVRQLPDSLPVVIPVPDGAHVVGSQILGPLATIVLDVDQPAEQVLDYYRARLVADGWMPQPDHQTGGFAPAWLAPALLYCRSARPFPLRPGHRHGGRADRCAAQPEHRCAPVALRGASPACWLA